MGDSSGLTHAGKQATVPSATKYTLPNGLLSSDPAMAVSHENDVETVLGYHNQAGLCTKQTITIRLVQIQPYSRGGICFQEKNN